MMLNMFHFVRKCFVFIWLVMRFETMTMLPV